MKILCFTDTLTQGGAERQLVNIAVGLADKGYEVHFLILYDGSFFKEQLKNKNIHLVCMNSRYRLLSFLKVRKYLRSKSFDVVLSFLYLPALFSVFSLFPSRKFKLVIGERSCDIRDLNNPVRRFFKFFYLCADKVVANSFESVNLFRKTVPFVKDTFCQVIYNILYAKDWIPVSYPDFNGFYRIVVLASYEKQKNILRLLKSLLYLSEEERMRIHIDWYGKVKNIQLYRCSLDYIEKYGLSKNISLHQELHDVKLVMNDAHFLGLFSVSESLPNAVCEGMMLAKPIIAARISDVPLLLDENSNFLCDPFDVKSIAFAIKKALCTSVYELERFGRYNRMRALSIFDNNKAINLYDSLFKDICK